MRIYEEDIDELVNLLKKMIYVSDNISLRHVFSYEIVFNNYHEKCNTHEKVYIKIINDEVSIIVKKCLDEVSIIVKKCLKDDICFVSKYIREPDMVPSIAKELRRLTKYISR